MERGIVDIHCHILPGVDDGANGMNEAYKLLRLEHQQGVRDIILTPHFRSGMFETDRDRIRERFRELAGNLKNVGIDVRLYLGCELHQCEDMIERLESDPAYTLAESDYVLTEFSEKDSAEQIERCITELLHHGYIPVIAHVERYPAMCDIKQIRHIVEVGAYIQVNAGSLLGREGWHSRRFTGKLLSKGYIHFIGSDAHDLRRRTPCMDECEAFLVKKTGKANAEKLLMENPYKILTNEKL
ncbi:MAG: capsular biosynthesis protein [Lachnospiraceae bacterium]|nr:capsular biosynthesis protein [Lachnospiraceae bacterium]